VSNSNPPQKGHTKLIVLGIAVLALVVLSRVLPLKTYTQQMLDTLVEYGGVGLVILAAIYVIACILLIPGSLLTLGAGAIAITLWPQNLLMAIAAGYATVCVGSVVGATAAFLLGRTLMRAWVEEKIMRNEKFRALDEAIGENGLKVVFLIRLSPAFPFNLLNYALGLTKVSLRDYVLASCAGMLPGTIMYVYFGIAAATAAAQASGTAEGNTSQKILMGIGLLATIVLVIMVTRVAKKALEEAVAKPPKKSPSTRQGDAS
jgi:uncharacterized membrane protein YdjX (TVP38/TMEM64 family)